MKKGIIGKKIGMTQIFDEKGNVIPVTVIEAGPCTVSQLKTLENDGYEAVQLGFESVEERKVTKPLKGHFAKNQLALKRHLKEFRLEDISGYSIGDTVTADLFAAGEKVRHTEHPKVTIQRVVKRWGCHQLRRRTVSDLYIASPVQWVQTHPFQNL